MAKINVKPADMVQVTISEKMTASFLEAYKANKPYEKQVWNVVSVYTLAQFCENIDPSYKGVTSAYVIAKKRNDNNKIFHKIVVEFDGKRDVEWELPYSMKVDLEEGDEIDIKTLLFCMETHDTGEVDKERKPIIKKHLFATGELL